MVRVAVVAEKISLLREFIPHIIAIHPDLDTDSFVRVMANPVMDLDWVFELPLDGPSRFPRGMTWGDFPAIRAPTYRPFDPTGSHRAGSGWSVGFGLGSAYDVSTPCRDDDAVEAIRRFGEADLVYAAMDASSPSVHAFQRAIEVLRPDAANDEAVRYPWMTDFSSTVLARTVRDGRSWRSVREEHLAHSVAKRRFTYNYALNAHAILGREMRIARAEAGLPDLPDGRLVASRNALQLLYALRSVGRPMDDGRIIHMMATWRGTGKYPWLRRSEVMGSGTSQLTIIQHLIEGALVHSASDRHGKDLMVSPLGLAYLDRLHPDCEDPDQGMRLENWRMLPLDESIPRIDRYLRTFFGKQKRYGAKVR